MLLTVISLELSVNDNENGSNLKKKRPCEKVSFVFPLTQDPAVVAAAGGGLAGK